MNEDFKMPTIVFVDTELQLQKAVVDLSSKAEIAVDLEFDNNRFHYGFTLCLIQVSTREVCYIIDPIKLTNLKELFDLFENPVILKIMHTPGEDLRLLHSLSCFPKSVFDTDFCARLLNYENPSLANLLALLFNTTLDKRHQTSNWHNRPLSREQIEYAALDVVWLFQLKDYLFPKLTETPLVPYMQEEMDYLAQVRYTPPDKENLLTKSDKASLTDYDQFILNELLKFRDRMGLAFNLPPAHVISNPMIREIADGKIDLTEWCQMKGIYFGVRNEKIQRMIQTEYAKAIRAANERNIPKVRTRPKRDPEDTAELGFWDKQQIISLKEKYLKPVQQELINNFGENAGRFILGEGVSSDIVRGKSKISELRGAFRQELILATAKKLSIDLSSFR